MKPTLIIGASTNPHRYSYTAIKRLQGRNHPIYAIGRREGEVAGISIVTDKAQLNLPSDLHTVTLYIRPEFQESYIDWIIALNPNRVIFNPGTENVQFAQRLEEEAIPYLYACTLVMLGTGQY